MTKKILLNIEATSYCSARCSMCPRELVKKNGFMQEETLEALIAQVDPAFCWEIDFAGRGEPTLHKKLPELIRIAKKAGVPVAVVTTAVLMNEKLLESISESVDKIRLSVSSIIKEDFDKVHIGLNYSEIWSNISKLSKVAASKCTIHLTGGPTIYNSLPDTVAHLRDLNFNEIYLFPLWNRGGFFNSNIDNIRRQNLIKKLKIHKAEKEYCTTGKMEFLADLLVNKLKNSCYCPVGNSSMSVAFNGDILGCFQDFGHSSIIGNITENNLKDTWQQRKKVLGKMKICEGCDSNKVALFI